MKKLLLFTVIVLSTFLSASLHDSVISSLDLSDKKKSSITQDIVNFTGYAYSRYRTPKNLKSLQEEGWDIHEIKGLTGGISGFTNPTQSVMALFAAKKDHLVISFRGIESIADIVTVHKFRKVSECKEGDIKSFGATGKVHLGFLETLLSMRTELNKQLLNLSKRQPLNKTHITFTGHGIGGSLAVLASEMIAYDLNNQGINSENIQILTLGAPYVGDNVFTVDYSKKFGTKCFNTFFTTDLGVGVFKNLASYTTNSGISVPIPFKPVYSSMTRYFSNWWYGRSNAPFNDRHYHFDGNPISMIEDYIQVSASYIDTAKNKAD